MSKSQDQGRGRGVLAALGFSRIGRRDAPPQPLARADLMADGLREFGGEQAGAPGAEPVRRVGFQQLPARFPALPARLPAEAVRPRANSLMVLFPYCNHGTWVFDDDTAGLVQEAFVAGIPEILERMTREAGIPLKEARNGFKLIFGATGFPGSLEFRRMEAEEFFKGAAKARKASGVYIVGAEAVDGYGGHAGGDVAGYAGAGVGADAVVGDESPTFATYGGTYYTCVPYGMVGWLCPALFRYFASAPEKLFAKAEKLPEGMVVKRATPQPWYLHRGVRPGSYFADDELPAFGGAPRAARGGPGVEALPAHYRTHGRPVRPVGENGFHDGD